MMIAKKFFVWVKEEIISVIPAIIYFLIAFHLIYYTVGLSLDEHEIRYFSWMSVTLSAFIVGKVLIITNALPVMNLFPPLPMIYNIIWKFSVYMICLFLLWVMEAFLHLYFHFDNFDLVMIHLKLDLTSPRFWSTFLWLTYLFIIFVTASEFIHAIGSKKVLKMLFEKPEK